MKTGMGSHQQTVMKNDEWLTPPSLIKALCIFDLDPCSPIQRPWDTADHHYNQLEDGLNAPWFGRVWCNPPYGLEAILWLRRLADYGNGIALIFARTETVMFFDQVWDKADSILFLKGRLFFHYVDGTQAKANAGAPSCLIAYGKENTRALLNSGIPGKLIILEGDNEETMS